MAHKVWDAPVYGLQRVLEVVAVAQLRLQILRHLPDVCLQALPHVPVHLRGAYMSVQLKVKKKYEQRNVQQY